MAIELDKHELRSYELRKRRQKQIITIITIVVVLVVIGFLYIAVNAYLHKDYTSYQVIHKVERKDSSSARYVQYGSGVIRYSRDGAMAMDSAGNLIWNGTFQMKDPILDVCDKYAVISDRGYKTLQIFNGEGKMTTIDVPNSIIKSKIANQGVTAVLMDGDNTNYLSIYDEEGTVLVNRRTVNKKDGFPLDIAISKDGRKLVTGYLSFNDGKVHSVLTFYNFGGVGQNFIDKIVGIVDFGQTIVPRIEFLNNNTFCAFSDNSFRLYSIEETPKEIYKETFKSDIKSILYSSKYAGFVLNNGEGSEKYRLVIYDLKGNVILDKNISYEYDTIYIAGEEIILYSDQEWIILTTGGQEKFHYSFESGISYIMPVNHIDRYIIIDNVNMEEVKLSEKKEEGEKK